MKSILTTLATGAALVATLGACSTGTADYKAVAEKLIASTLAKDIGLGDLAAKCDKPAKSDPAVGDTFDCSATTPDGEVITFVATLDKPGHINVNTSNLIAPDAVTRIGAAAVGLLEEQLGITIGADNMDCGSKSIIVDATAPELVCGLTDTSDGSVYDATITIDDLANPDRINVVVADTPRG